jgi:hypothetical protein
MRLLNCKSGGFKRDWVIYQNKLCDAFYNGKCLLEVDCGNQEVVIKHLCSKKWIRQNKNKHSDFIPSIEITVGQHKITYKGELKRGELKKILADRI